MKVLFVTGDKPEFRWFPVSEKLPQGSEFTYLFMNKRSPVDFLKNLFALFKLQKRSDVIIVKGIVYELLFLYLVNGIDLKKKWILVEIGFEQHLSFLKEVVLKIYLAPFMIVQTFTHNLKNYLLRFCSKETNLYVLPCMFSYTNDFKFEEETCCNIHKNQVLSVGRTGRDFEYFFSEIKQLDLPALIIGKVNFVAKSTNISILNEVPFSFLVKIMKNSKYLVISLIDSDFPLGIRLIFLGMQLKCFVLFTNISGNYEYFNSHKFLDKITFQNKPGELSRKLKILSKESLDEIIVYNSKFIKEKFSPNYYCDEFIRILQCNNLLTEMEHTNNVK